MGFRCQVDFIMCVPKFVAAQSRPWPRGGTIAMSVSRSSSTMAWSASAVVLSRRLSGNASCRPDLTKRLPGTHETVQNLGVVTPLAETDSGPKVRLRHAHGEGAPAR